MRRIFLHGVDMRGGAIYDARLRGVDLWDIDIRGDLKNIRVNGVDIVPLIEAELNRRDPDRAKMRPVEWQHRDFAERDLAGLAQG